MTRSHSASERKRKIGAEALEAVGRQQWLDRPGYRLEHVLAVAFASFGRNRDRVSNALHGTWLGHPLHPALTALPTGAVATTLALDAASVLPGHTAGLRDASRLALGVGIIGSLGAAATGATDWQHTHAEPRRIGIVHGFLNVVATALYSLSWWDRRRGRHLRGMAKSALGYGLTLGSGYLGGALVFGSGVGVDQSGPRVQADEWTPVLPVAELNGRPQRVEIHGVGVVLHCDGDGVLAVGEYCPHLRAPMSDGWVDHGRVVCPWHGSRFECRTGDVLKGPATASLPSYPTRVRGGMVEVYAR
ncbi:Rieske 2Fe-2S domain-containing protein [Mycobacterium sp. NPDC048908]|uniref:Rieske 2Fe-2S domain-containing protein n=1 Tax=Mycobacterium sp. NPDC048908 TaxID=3364292 RepID=UPI00371D9BC8